MVRAVAWLAFGPKSWGEGSWVKNGDRWTITRIGRRGDLTVRHNRSQLTVRLPIDYVRESTGLGYATTIHAAQGVSADTMHGLVDRAGVPAAAVHHAHPRPARQPPLPPSRRRRRPPHPHPTRHHLTAHADRDLQQILARDEAPISASTLLRELNDPAARLFQAVQRYTDGLHVAAEQLLGPQTVQSSTAEPTRSCPTSPASRRGRPSGTPARPRGRHR